MRFAKFFSVLATVAMAGCLTAFATSPSSTAFHPEDETFSESCTTIAVGKLASSDGSIMTAHSCDSNYRTWLSMEKPVEFAPGSMDPVYSGKLHTEFRDDTKGHSMIIKYLKRGEVPAPEGPTIAIFFNESKDTDTRFNTSELFFPYLNEIFFISIYGSFMPLMSFPVTFSSVVFIIRLITLDAPLASE